MKTFTKGSLVTLPPNEAAKHGDKLRLVDMKACKYRVEEEFNVNKPKVKSAPRKAANKG
jgi:hypothetical protein